MSVPMTRLCSLLLLGLAWACSDRVPVPRPSAPPAPVRSQNSGLGPVASVEPVHIEEGFTVWRHGVEVTVQDGLLIHLDGVHPDLFMPRGIGPPLFVLGDTVGQTLISPSFDRGQAVLLMDSPPPDTEIALWMTRVGAIRQLVAGPELKVQQSWALAADAHAGINIRTPPASAPRARYPTLIELGDRLVPPRRAPGICAERRIQCGFLPGNIIGRLDCGPCPTGQACTPDHQCCTPTTCEALGLTCGYADDGCGGLIDCGLLCFRP